MIHETAIIAPDARVPESATVGPFAVIGSGVRLGENVTVGAHALIDGNTTIGSGTQVFPYAAVGTPPQDKKYDGEPVFLRIGDDNVIREFTTLNPGTGDGGSETVIGSGNLLMAYVHVAHDCRIGNNNVFSNNAQMAGHVEIGNDCVVGGMTGIHQFVRVGDGAMVGGGSMVTLDVPPWCIAAGNRATLHGLNLVGLKRLEIPSTEISALKETFKVLFRQKKQLQDALELAAGAHSGIEPVERMIRFIQASERGVTRPEN